ncbi:uncharacterized protein LOC105632305 [Jatropha curcas]|uniref:uncharacterized protein LOC105632305 n=1 Tax=Jatropha curcas TaxID=180498 RepID=UPI0005FADA96|nr:uncharacterized protein LOC105632305 [Jatropha curcas]
MADTNYNYTKYQTINNNPNKFYSHFLYKALLVTIFLVILPLFPSQAPEFINHTLNTRGWEFLQLIFVGIAVSYGLFSRRNDETEKDSNSNNSNTKFDNAQSYVSKFLQVSSVFDDETDTPSRSDGVSTVQTWNNQYCRNEPVVVVETEHSVLDKEQKQRVATNSRISEKEKPLLLPVRSLKSRVLDVDRDENVKAYQDFEEKLKDNVVLPSPIPWRTRSGRMEIKGKEDGEETDNPPLYTLPPSMEESFRATPNKFSHISTETQAKGAEDFVRKKSIYRSPPPPPPPPPLIRKSKSMKENSNQVFIEKDLKRSFTGKFGEGRQMLFDEAPPKKEKQSRDRVTFMAQPSFKEFPKEEKEEYVEKIVMESEDDDMETEYEDEEEEEIAGRDFGLTNSKKNEQVGSDGGPDVDKKADEFIAKFREQIRLQRIESIKRSSGQINRKAAASSSSSSSR